MLDTEFVRSTPVNYYTVIHSSNCRLNIEKGSAPNPGLTHVNFVLKQRDYIVRRSVQCRVKMYCAVFYLALLSQGYKMFSLAGVAQWLSNDPSTKRLLV